MNYKLAGVIWNEKGEMVMNKDLQALERLRNTLLAEGYWQDVLQDVSVIEKSLKALEIIKEKEVDIHDLLNSETVNDYNNKTHWLGFKGDLTQEEYEILKEVLK